MPGHSDGTQIHRILERYRALCRLRPWEMRALAQKVGIRRTSRERADALLDKILSSWQPPDREFWAVLEDASIYHWLDAGHRRVKTAFLMVDGVMQSAVLAGCGVKKEIRLDPSVESGTVRMLALVLKMLLLNGFHPKDIQTKMPPESPVPMVRARRWEATGTERRVGVVIGALPATEGETDPPGVMTRQVAVLDEKGVTDEEPPLQPGDDVWIVSPGRRSARFLYGWRRDGDTISWLDGEWVMNHVRRKYPVLRPTL